MSKVPDTITTIYVRNRKQLRASVPKDVYYNFERQGCVHDKYNHCIYVMTKTIVSVYYYNRGEYIENYLDLKTLLGDLEIHALRDLTDEVTSIGNVYFIANFSLDEGIGSDICKVNLNLKTFQRLNKHDNILDLNYTKMIYHHDEKKSTDQLLIYGNRFKSNEHFLVSYNIQAGEYEYLFNSGIKQSTGSDYGDCSNIEINKFNNKFMAVGTTSFMFQAFCDGVSDYDLWCFDLSHPDSFKRICAENAEDELPTDHYNVYFHIPTDVKGSTIR